MLGTLLWLIRYAKCSTTAVLPTPASPITITLPGAIKLASKSLISFSLPFIFLPISASQISLFFILLNIF